MNGPEARVGTPHLDWLFGLQRFGMHPGLGRMRELLERVGSPDAALRCVLVAGTNGKGSVARTLAACLRESGERTALYTSPHLQHVGERVQVDALPSTEDELEDVVARVRRAAEETGATFFEVLTAAALVRFAEAGARWAVLEVGLGGRLDATNAVEPVLSCVTTVALDHTAILGDTVEAIAAEKAGVLRAGVQAVSGVLGPAGRVIEERAAGLGAPLVVYGREFWGEAATLSWEGTAFTWRRVGGGEGDGMRVVSPLVGRHQVANLALGLEAARAVGVGAATAVRAVASARWPGRLEPFEHRGRRVVLDGAHNPAAAVALAEAVRELEGGVAVLVFGASADKDVRGVLAELAPLARTVVLTHAARSPRAMSPAAAAAELPPGVGAPLVAADPERALELAMECAGPGETVLVAGSLFLVGEARDVLTGGPVEDRLRFQ